jgi:hypothetical protein
VWEPRVQSETQASASSSHASLSGSRPTSVALRSAIVCAEIHKVSSNVVIVSPAFASSVRIVRSHRELPMSTVTTAKTTTRGGLGPNPMECSRDAEARVSPSASSPFRAERPRTLAEVVHDDPSRIEILDFAS